MHVMDQQGSQQSRWGSQPGWSPSAQSWAESYQVQDMEEPQLAGVAPFCLDEGGPTAHRENKPKKKMQMRERMERCPQPREADTKAAHPGTCHEDSEGTKM